MRTIAAAHKAFIEKKISPVELTQEYFQTIRNTRTLYGPGCQNPVYLTLCEERALAQAQAAERILTTEGIPANKPLLGIPMGIKDNLVIEGVRTTCASKILDNYIPPYTATAVKRLEEAGAVILGKLNMDEFAMGGSNENSAYGPVKYPLYGDRVPGGSSGGSAVAVKFNLCLAALGSDTGGSIRLPASYCGVVGFKPTYGSVSRYGLVAYASSLDQIGPMAYTVDDTLRILQTIEGPDQLDAMCLPSKTSDSRISMKDLTIGIPQEYFVDGISNEVRQAINEAIGWFATQGAKIKPVSLPHTSLAIAVYYIIAMCEASSNLARFDGVRFGIKPPEFFWDRYVNLAEYYQAVRNLFGAEVKRRIILGTFALSSGYYDAYYDRACRVRRLIQQDFLKAFEEVDVLLSPVAPTTAFKLGEKIQDPLQMYLNDIFTIPVNLAGLPALSVPCGWGSDSLPIGLQIIGQPGDDSRVLGVAQAFEETLAW